MLEQSRRRSESKLIDWSVFYFLQILMALALFGDGLLKGIGIIIGVEMQDML